MEEINNIINNKVNRFTGNGRGILDILLDAYNYWYKFLSNLTLDQLLSVCYISLAINILFRIEAILTIYYGNYIIDYFKLETRFPKLANIIKLRRKFQSYSIIWNTILIIVALIIIIVLNLHYLLR